MKKMIILMVEDDREYDIYEELDTLDGITYHTVTDDELMEFGGQEYIKYESESEEE